MFVEIPVFDANYIWFENRRKEIERGIAERDGGDCATIFSISFLFLVRAQEVVCIDASEKLTTKKCPNYGKQRVRFLLE